MSTIDNQPRHDTNSAGVPPAPSEGFPEAGEGNATPPKPTYTQLRDSLEYMLDQAGHLDADYPGDYDFSNERAVLEQADAAEPESPQHLFRKAVALRILYWDTVRALEMDVTDGGDFTDRQNDTATDLIDNLAAGSAAGLTFEEAYDGVSDGHVAELLRIVEHACSRQVSHSSRPGPGHAFPGVHPSINVTLASSRGCTSPEKTLSPRFVRSTP